MGSLDVLSFVLMEAKYRQLVSGQHLRFAVRWSVLDHGYKSYLGCQDETHVTIKFSGNRNHLEAPLAVSWHCRRDTKYVPGRRN